jgi:integrating conjugative element protein (TIGR03757 family)
MLVALALYGPLLFSAALQAGEPPKLEVFTAAEFPVSGQEDRRLQRATVTTYVVDGLDQFESMLSQNLPVAADAARAEALRRIGALDEARMAPARSAAVGLARAIQLGVDRYPAIVFDGHAVVYGVTDLGAAIDRFEAWQQEPMQ